MVSCAAKGCKNTSVKGVKMNYFPKDINKRKMWIQNAKLENKMLSSSAALCEVIFSLTFLKHLFTFYKNICIIFLSYYILYFLNIKTISLFLSFILPQICGKIYVLMEQKNLKLRRFPQYSEN